MISGIPPDIAPWNQNVRSLCLCDLLGLTIEINAPRKPAAGSCPTSKEPEHPSSGLVVTNSPLECAPKPKQVPHSSSSQTLYSQISDMSEDYGAILVDGSAALDSALAWQLYFKGPWPEVCVHLSAAF